MPYFLIESLNLMDKNMDNKILLDVPYKLEINAYRYEDLTDPDVFIKPIYRSNSLLGYKKGVDDFFEIFKIFKEEMSFIIDSEDKSLFENVLTILLRLVEKFKVNSNNNSNTNLEQLLIDYIEDLGKYTFFSLEKNELRDQISRMIYSMRRFKIEFYEATLREYLGRRKQYNEILNRILNNQPKYIF